MEKSPKYDSQTKPKEISLEMDERLDMLADLIIDRFIADKERGQLQMFRNVSMIENGHRDNNGTPNITS